MRKLDPGDGGGPGGEAAFGVDRACAVLCNAIHK